MRVLDVFFEREHVDLQTFLKEQTVAQQLHQGAKQEIELIFKPAVCDFAQRQKYAFGFVREFVQEERLHLIFENRSIEILARWLIAFGNDVTVVRPLALQLRLFELAQEVYQHYHPQKAPTLVD